MGALDDGHYDVELENTLKLGVEEEEAEIQAAVRVLLQGLGEDVNREGIKKTPLRVAKAFRHATKGYKQNVTDIIEGAIFPEAGLDNNKIGHAGGAGGLVIVRDLDLFSYCESCLLPFQVKCHVGYVPSGQQVVGLSKLSRVADVFSKRLQDPQRLANEVCSALQRSIKSAGTAVLLHCHHIHFPALDSMFLGSSSDGWIEALVASGTGIFNDQEADIWSEFFSLLRLKRSLVDKIEKRRSEKQWCPSQSKTANNISLSMINAVTSILKSLGEDPLRKELIDTPARFLNWMINFRNCKVEMNLNICNKMLPRKPYEEVKYDMPMHSALSLPFWSQCEHHLLPFHGVVHIGYFSVEGVDPIRKSLLQSIVHFYGFKLQVQERLTRQIAESVAPLLGGDIIVVAEASHMCMIARGVEKFGSSTATVAVLGRFSVDAKARALFLDSLPDSKDC